MTYKLLHLCIRVINKYQNCITDPEPITDLNATYTTRDSVHLVWTLPRGQYDAFEIQYLDNDATVVGGGNTGTATSSVITSPYSSSSDNGGGGGGLLVQNLTDKPWFTVQGLRPYRNYTFTVVVRAGGGGGSLPAAAMSVSQQQSASVGINNGGSTSIGVGYTSAAALLSRRSVPVSGTFATLEWVPGRCTRFQATDVQPGHLVLEWMLPESEHNGVLLRFVVSWTATVGTASTLSSSSSLDSGGGTSASSGTTVVQLRNGGSVGGGSEEGENDDDDVLVGRLSGGLNGLRGSNGGFADTQHQKSMGIQTGSEVTKTAYYEPWRNRATVKGLTPGRLYVFNISGESRVGRGPVATLEQRTPILGEFFFFWG